MHGGSTICASVDAYELCTKFFIGCFFNCLGTMTGSDAEFTRET